MVDSRHHDLVADLYGAITEPTQWLDVLERMRHILNAEVALQHAWRDICSIDLSLCTNADPAQMAKYQEHYWQHDPWMAGLDRMCPGRVALGRDFLSDDDYRASEFYQDFLRPQGFHWFMTAIDEVPPQGVSVVSFLRSPRAPDFGPADRRLLERWLPHIRNCLRIQRELDGFRNRVACLESALDQLAPGVLLLDGKGRVCYANAAAEDIVSRGAELGLRGGQLWLREPAAHARLVAAIEAPRTRGQALIERVPVPIVLRDRDGCIALTLIVAPFIANVRGIGRAAQTLVLLTPPQRTIPAVESYLRAVFGFTSAQAKCARLLADGLEPSEISAQLGIAMSTLRSHLQQLFIKTATRRQAALVATLLRALALRDLL